MKLGFDNKKYIDIQTKNIKERIEKHDKLYMECGGKLFDDYHAARCLPGFKIDSKLKVFQEFKKDLEIIFCISAKDIEKNKVRAEYGITYDSEVFRLIDRFKELKISINSVVITLFEGEEKALKFKEKLENHDIKTYLHTYTKGYPTDIDVIVSEEGYGKNPYITTTKPLVVVTAPGPGSGKLATCLSQLYHEYKNGNKAGYAKFETFPVWNLPLKHPLNIAYEAATADLNDKNMIDSFHLEKYGKTTVNYNRDLETFPILKSILKKISDKDLYYSPTDMGVNMVGLSISNDEVIKEECKKEIVRRYYQSVAEEKMLQKDNQVSQRIKILMNELDIDKYYLDVVKSALEKSEKEDVPVMSIKLPNGKIITGKQSKLLSAPAAAIINALKTLSNIPDDIDLLSPLVIEPIIKNKLDTISNALYNLQSQEVLIALAVSSVTNPTSQKVLNNLDKLKECEAHCTYILSNGDLSVLKSLKLKLTCESTYLTDELFKN